MNEGLETRVTHVTALSPNMNLGFRKWSIGMLSLTLATAIWGYANVVIQQTEVTIAPAIVMWLRFGIATVILAPILLQVRLNVRDFVLGLGMGAFMGLSVLAQGWGMITIPVDEVAFITGLYVVLTPMAAALLHRRWPHPSVWLAVAASLGGVALLIEHLSFITHVGVIWSFLAAIGFTVQIIGTASLSRRVPALCLASLQSIGAMVALSIAIAVQGTTTPRIYQGLFHWPSSDWLWILYLAIIAQVLACWLQVFGQARISATEAALTFNLEPVWTVACAWLALGEGLTKMQLLGAILILGSLSVVSIPSGSRSVK
jgi:drug/metabolite transporter (DMT)-like permease